MIKLFLYINLIVLSSAFFEVAKGDLCPRGSTVSSHSFWDIFNFHDQKEVEDGPNVCVSEVNKILPLKNGSSDIRKRDTNSSATKNSNRGDQKQTIHHGLNIHSGNVLVIGSRSASIESCTTGAEYCKCYSMFQNETVINETTTIYECCQGYGIEEGKPGCPKKLELKTMAETLKELKYDNFYNAIVDFDLVKELNSENFTVFAPSNEIFPKHIRDLVPDIVSNQLPGDSSEKENQNIQRDTIRSILLSHIVPGIVKSSHFDINVPLITMGSNDTPNKIKMNTYGDVWTANCIPLVKMDIITEKGVIHTIDQLMKPAMDSVYDVLKSRNKFTKFLKFIDMAGLKDKLKSIGNGDMDKNEFYTVLALTDESFDKVESGFMKRLNDGDNCALEAIKHHIIPKVICSKYIHSKVPQKVLAIDRTSQVFDWSFDFSGQLDGHYYINDNVTILQTDLPAINGLVHVVDSLSIPLHAMPLIERLKKEKNIVKFTELLTKHPEVMEDIKDSTIYIPNDKAFEELNSKILQKLEKDDSYARVFIKNHIIPNSQLINENIPLTRYSRLKSLSGQNLIAEIPYTIQCSRVISCPEKACQTKFSVVNKVIIPSDESDWLKTLNKYPDISHFTMLLSDIKYKLDNPNATYTIYAPSNAALTKDMVDLLKNTMPKKVRKRRMNKREKRETGTASDFINRHIKEGYECCSPYKMYYPNTYSRMGSPLMSLFTFWNIGDGLRGGKPITTCDIAAGPNVLLHIMDGVIENPSIPRR